jgi:Flp pilus assembly protein TadG
MNSRNARASAKFRRPTWSIGQSAVEFAIAVPILALLLVAGSDFARVFFYSIAINNAARAGAQYGSQSVITAVDEDGMETAATNDGSNIPGITATAKQCTCVTSTVTKCGGSYNCADYPKASFVEVDTTATFTTLVNYAAFGLTNSFTLNGKAVMQVQP